MTWRRALGRFPTPEQQEAELRAWDVVRAAFEEREPAAHRRSYRRLVVGVAAGLLLAASVVLSPAGATVGKWISRAFGVEHASRALISLPAPGRLLVSSSGGAWTVGASGSRRRIGAWTQASWSPHGRYLAVARHDELSAVNPAGVQQWRLERPHVSDPRWFPLSGYRVAYLSGSELRVVAGDGTQDHLVAAGVMRVAPAWRPGHPYQLAYVASGGRLRLKDADSTATLWSAAPGVRIHQLAWSADGSRLLAVSPRRVTIYSATGHVLSVRTAPGGGRIMSAALSPDGQTLSLVSGGPGNAVILLSLSGHRPLVRRVLTGFGLGQVGFSPNGRWLLITWPAADQWVFIRVVGAPRIAAVSRIAQHFSFGQNRQFPRFDGWCCSATGGAG